MGSMIEINCNTCSHAERIFHGSGFFGTNFHYYCSKCFTIEEYSEERPLFGERPKLKKEKLVEKIHSCKACKIKLKPFLLAFSETSLSTVGHFSFDTISEIKGPAGYRCPECHSKDLTYKDVGLWD